MVCTLSLHAEGPRFKSWQVVTYGFGVGDRFHISWSILILNKDELTHLVVHMDLKYGQTFTFDFDKFILISNLKTTDISFMPRVAVWISLQT